MAADSEPSFQLYSLITQHDSYLQVKLARDSLRDSKAMKTLSVLTILFLPGAFLATVFSTEMFEFESKDQEMRIYFAITAPLTVVLMVGWLLWMRTKAAVRAEDSEEGRVGGRGLTLPRVTGWGTKKMD